MATSPFALHLSTTAPQASGYTRFRPPVVSSSSSSTSSRPAIYTYVSVDTNKPLDYLTSSVALSLSLFLSFAVLDVSKTPVMTFIHMVLW